MSANDADGLRRAAATTGRPDRPTAPSTVADVGEAGLIAQLTAASQRAAAGLPDDTGGPVIGPGDDAAVLAVTGDLVVSTDSLVQDRHFRLSWSTPEAIGRRAAIQSAADVAAMGAHCSALVVSIACPPETDAQVVLALNDGLNAAATSIGARVVGGDLVSADQIVLTVTALGSTGGREPIPVSGARVGDTLAVSGPLGSSAAGLVLLGAAHTGYPDLIAAHRVPIVDLGQGVVASQYGAHAMTDISDGLVAELETMARTSGVSMEIDAALVPVADGLHEAAAELDTDVTDWILGGGEDHQLLAAFDGAVPPGWTAIGAVVARDDAHRVLVDGSPSSVRGWQSF